VFRIAVDAFNLAADRRGMGRYARTVLERLTTTDDIALTLVVRSEYDVPPASSTAHEYVTLA
jgi:hypothetical protein